MIRLHNLIRLCLQWGGAVSLVMLMLAFFFTRYFEIWSRPASFVSFDFAGGEIGIAWPANWSQPFNSVELFGCAARDPMGWNWGFSFDRHPGFCNILTFPMWVPLVLSVGVCMAGCRMRRAVAPQTCEKCGYDRRGLSEASSCPECGLAVQMSPSEVPHR